MFHHRGTETQRIWIVIPNRELSPRRILPMQCRSGLNAECSLLSAPSKLET